MTGIGIGIGLHLCGRSASAFDPLTGYDWYVDSVNGSDDEVTNVLPHSNDFDQGWQLNAASSLDPHVAPGPISGVLGSWLEDVSATGRIGISQQFGNTADTNTYNYSIYVRKDDTPSSYPSFWIEMFSGGTIVLAHYVIDPATGVLTETSIHSDAGNLVSDTGTEEIVVGGVTWWRVWVEVENDGNATRWVGFDPAFNADGSATANNAALGGHYIAAAQVTVGAGLQAYVGTQADPVTNTFGGTTAATAKKTEAAVRAASSSDDDTVAKVDAEGVATLIEDALTYRLFGRTVSVAYSVEKLHPEYDGVAIRLRRVDDDAESDFSYVGRTLDSDAISTWLNGSAARLVRFHNQINGESYEQLTDANQPLFVLSGIGGKPSVQFVASDVTRLRNPIGHNDTWAQPATLYMVFQVPDPHGGVNTTLYDNQNTSARFILQSDRKLIWRSNTILTGATALAVGRELLSTVVANGASSLIRIDGVQDASGDAGTNGNDSGSMSLGARANNTEPSDIALSELIRAPTDTVDTGLETQIMASYGISA